MLSTRRNYQNGRLRFSDLVAERIEAIQEARRLIVEAGAGTEMHQITRDAGIVAERDNSFYLPYVRARLAEFLDRKRRLLIHGDWPAPAFVPRPSVYPEPRPAQLSVSDWQQIEPGAALQYELYVRGVAFGPLAEEK